MIEYCDSSFESEEIGIEVDLEREKQTISLPNAYGLLFVTVEKNGEVIHSQKIIRL